MTIPFTAEEMAAVGVTNPWRARDNGWREIMAEIDPEYRNVYAQWIDAPAEAKMEDFHPGLARKISEARVRVLETRKLA